MYWIAEWTTTGHNIWRCNRCNHQESFPSRINPNNLKL